MQPTVSFTRKYKSRSNILWTLNTNDKKYLTNRCFTITTTSVSCSVKEFIHCSCVHSVHIPIIVSVPCTSKVKLFTGEVLKVPIDSKLFSREDVYQAQDQHHRGVGCHLPVVLGGEEETRNGNGKSQGRLRFTFLLINIIF